MQGGRLRHRVALQSATTAKNAVGEDTRTWATFATVWAAVEVVGGSEYQAQEALHASLTHRVRLRYRDDVTREQRVVWRSRELEIESVEDPDDRRRELHLLCREIV